MNKEWNLPDINAALDVVNRQLMIYHYRNDYKRYQKLCSKRAALSIKLFTRDRRKLSVNSGIEDNYCTPCNINILKNL